MEIKDFSSHIFWSYDKSSELKPEIVIRQVIVYGEVKDMILLARMLGRTKIHDAIRKWKDLEKYEKHINFFEKVILG